MILALTNSCMNTAKRPTPLCIYPKLGHRDSRARGALNWRALKRAPELHLSEVVRDPTSDRIEFDKCFVLNTIRYLVMTPASRILLRRNGVRAAGGGSKLTNMQL